jgi:regulator of CtrA degradation
MALVEDTAAYLDGEGRTEAKALARQAALAYATESMRLTTRLMQLASWLLLHRAVNEGEMSLVQARKEKTKVKVSTPESHDESARPLLPTKLQDLIEQSVRLQRRVMLLDTTIHTEAAAKPPLANPIEHQMELIRSAFVAAK